MDLETDVAATGEEIPEEVKRQISDRERTRPPNPFSYSCKHISTVARVKYDPRIGKELTRIRFAFVSLNGLADGDGTNDLIPLCGDCRSKIGSEKCRTELLNNSSEEPPPCQIGLDVQACRRRLYGRDGGGTSVAWGNYQEALSEAVLRHKANVVVVNEMGIPITAPYTETDFFRWTRDLAGTDKKGVLIIAGSFHDQRTKYNTGYMFTPGGPPTGHVFHKQVSAVGVNEYVSVPPGRRSLFVRAFGVTIAVVLCLDLMDYSAIGPLMNYSERIDFILVPSHSVGMEGLERVAATVSDALPGGVGIVNHCGHRVPASLYVFGALEKPKKQRELKKGREVTAKITLFDITRKPFEDDKNSKQGKNKDLEWLFKHSAIESA